VGRRVGQGARRLALLGDVDRDAADTEEQRPVAHREVARGPHPVTGGQLDVVDGPAGHEHATEVAHHGGHQVVDLFSPPPEVFDQGQAGQPGQCGVEPAVPQVEVPVPEPDRGGVDERSKKGERTVPVGDGIAIGGGGRVHEDRDEGEGDSPQQGDRERSVRSVQRDEQEVGDGHDDGDQPADLPWEDERVHGDHDEVPQEDVAAALRTDGHQDEAERDDDAQPHGNGPRSAPAQKGPPRPARRAPGPPRPWRGPPAPRPPPGRRARARRAPDRRGVRAPASGGERSHRAGQNRRRVHPCRPRPPSRTWPEATGRHRGCRKPRPYRDVRGPCCPCMMGRSPPGDTRAVDVAGKLGAGASPPAVSQRPIDGQRPTSAETPTQRAS